MLSPTAQTTLRQLKSALPEREWRAVEAWLSCFYPYQLEWLLDWGRFSLLCKSRQIGASHTYAAAAVLWGMFGDTTNVVSKGEREGLEVVAKAKLHAEVLHKLGSHWAKPTGTAFELRLASGGRIIALPATSGGRGFSGNVILDEFAYHVDAERVADGAGGTAMHGYKTRILSTPNGVGNLFHTYWSDENTHRGYTLHAVTLEEAIADGIRVDLDECWKMARNDPRVFDQLFRCKFLDNDAQYIPSEAVEASIADIASEAAGTCFAGIDVGKTSDLTVLVVVRVGQGGVAEVVNVETRKRTAFEDLDQLVRFAVGRKCRRICIDSTGIGAFPSEQLRKKYGMQLIEPVQFTLNSKEELATTLYQRFAERKVRMPRSDSALRDDVTMIRRIVTSAGNVRYDANRTANGHADRAWALALALHAHTSMPPPVRRALPNFT